MDFKYNFKSSKMETNENVQHSLEMQTMDGQDTGTKEEEGIDQFIRQKLILPNDCGIKSSCCTDSRKVVDDEYNAI